MLLGLIACSPETRAPNAMDGLASGVAGAASGQLGSAERAVHIAAVQATAGPEYAVRQSTDHLTARNPSHGMDLRWTPQGVSLRGRAPFGDYTLTLGLAEIGCAGETRPVTRTAPSAAGARAQYLGLRGAGVELSEWYANGPLGLEQGFTLDHPVDCGRREVELKVAVGGTLVPSAVEPGVVRFRAATGGVVARYSDLHVVDAAGRTLPARLDVLEGHVRIRFDAADAVFPVVVDPLVAIEQAKLVPSNAPAMNEYGYFLALSGDTAMFTDSVGLRVFDRVGTTWVEQATLTGPTGEQLGGDVALDGDTAVVRDFWQDAVYVFVRVNGVWSFQTQLAPDDPPSPSSFGDAVAISGDTIVVGDTSDGADCLHCGAVYVFVRNGAAWSQQARLLASDRQPDIPESGANGDALGWDVAIHGDAVVAGAPDADGVGLGTGAVYVFTRTGGAWSEQAKLVPSTGYLAGSSVAVHDDTLLFATANGAQAFVRSGAVWTDQGELLPDNFALGDLKTGLALEGDVALVKGWTDPNQDDAVFIFERSGGVWSKRSFFLPSDDNAFFGLAIALSGSTALVSSGFLGIPLTSGVYVFRLGLPNGASCVDAAECATEFCVDGVCCATECDAGPCDSCSVATGANLDGTCAALTGPLCDDHNACTTVDTCKAGACVGAMPLDCPSADDCHDNCDPSTGECIALQKPDGVVCDDGNACTVGDACAAGLCVGDTSVTCTASDDCHDVGACVPETGQCSAPPLPDGSPCDGGVCTAGECRPDEGAGGHTEAGSEGGASVVGGCGCRVGGNGANRSAPFVATAFLGLIFVRRLRGRSRSLGVRLSRAIRTSLDSTRLLMSSSVAPTLIPPENAPP